MVRDATVICFEVLDLQVMKAYFAHVGRMWLA